MTSVCTALYLTCLCVLSFNASTEYVNVVRVPRTSCAKYSEDVFTSNVRRGGNDSKVYYYFSKPCDVISSTLVVYAQCAHKLLRHFILGQQS